MEAFDDTTSNNEPTTEELNLLLDKSYKWIGDLIAVHASEYDTNTAILSTTTPEAQAKYRLGELFVEDLNGVQFEVSLTESNHLTSEDSTVEHYELSYEPNNDTPALYATGAQPDSMEDLLNSDVTDEEYVKAVRADKERLRQLLHPASPAETQRLAYILEVGVYGDDLVNFRELEKQFQPHVDELYKLQEEVEELQDENENHPE